MAYNRTTRDDLSSAGVMVAYAFETVPEERPTTGWTHIPGISSIPAMNEAPNILPSTTLDETVEETGIPALKPMPSATGFTANYTKKLRLVWTDMYNQYEQAKKQNLHMWITVDIPNEDKAFYFVVEPSPLGLPGIEVGNVITIDLYLTKRSEVIQDEKPESIAAWTGAAAQAAYTANTRTSKYSDYDDGK